MKRLAILFCLALIALPAFAGLPAKSELSFSGSAIRTDLGTDWRAAGEILFNTGHFLAGPAISVVEPADASGDLLFGASAELNFSRAGCTPFLRAAGLTGYEDQIGGNYSVRVGAGGKCGGTGAAAKFTAEKVVKGVGKDNDLELMAGIVLKF